MKADLLKILKADWPKRIAALMKIARGEDGASANEVIRAHEQLATIEATLEPPQAADTPANLRAGQEAWAAKLEALAGVMVPCPECRFLVFEWYSACPRCGLNASAVSEEHMQRLREGRTNDDWSVDIYTFSVAIENWNSIPRGPKAITDETGGASDAGAEEEDEVEG